MGDFGLIGVDWETRIDFDRMRRERLQKAKDALAASEADLLFVFRDDDVRYMTGFRGHMGPQPVIDLGMATIVLVKGDDPYLFTMDYEHAKARMPWMDPKRILPGVDFLTPQGPGKWLDTVRSLIGELNGKTIGVDTWTFAMETGVRNGLSDVTFVDGRDILMNAKIIKTEDELECMRTAYAISEAGMSAGLQALRPGIRECEVLSIIWQTMTALGSEWSQCANIVCSGPYTAPYRRFTSDRVIRAGDLVIIDIGGCYNGYWGDFTRTYLCGNARPTEAEKALHQEDYDTLFAACEASRAGNTTRDVAARLQSEHSGGLGEGHGAGIGPWEAPWFPMADEGMLHYGTGYEVTLQRNMSFSLEPYAGIPGIGGVRLENELIVTDDEPEIYSTFPFDERLLSDVHPLDKTTGRVSATVLT